MVLLPTGGSQTNSQTLMQTWLIGGLGSSHRKAWWRKVHTSPTAAEQGLVSGWRGIHILWISDDSYLGHSLQFVDSWVLCWKGLLLFFLHATAQKAVLITTALLGWSYSHGTELFWVCWAFPKEAEVGVWGN